MTRDHYLRLGLISNREPSTANWYPMGPKLSPNELEARGFVIAANAARHREWGVFI